MLAVVLVALVAAAAPAAAHAELVSSDPSPGAVLATPPAAVTLEFDEEVEAVLGGIRVVDANEVPVDVGEPRHDGGDPNRIRANLPDLNDGTYVVAWRVTSADSHPVKGAFTFQVGAGSAADTRALVAGLLEGSGGGAAGTGLDVARFVGYVGVALLAGALVALGLVWPGGAGRPGVRRLVTAGWVLSVVGAVGAFALEGPYATGRGLGQAFDTDLWSAVADTRFGRATLVRAVLLGVGGGVLLLTLRRARAAWWRASAAGLLVLVALAVALAGHAGTERLPGLGIAADIVHVSAMAVWLGGLALLGLIGLRGPATTPTPARAGAAPPGATPSGDAPPPARSVGAASAAEMRAPLEDQEELAASPGDDGSGPRLHRWSTVAATCVGALVVSGVVQAWRLVGGLDALVSTSYGRTLLVKTALVVAMVGLAAGARRALQRREGVSLRQFVRDELAFGVGILAVTAVLTGTAPAQATTAQPFSTTVVENSVIADITIDPAQAQAPNLLHLLLTPPGGSLQRIADVEVRFTLPARDFGPLPVPVEPAGPNHWVASGVVLPYAGDWRMEIVAQVSQFDQVRLAATVPIR